MLSRRAVIVAASLACLTGAGFVYSAASGAPPRDVPQVTVYSSLPLQGAQRTIAEATLNGARLALRQAGGRAGRFAVTLHALDDSTPEIGHWDPGQTSRNARQAARDRSAVAYIGEWNSGATAVSLPILNVAGMPQVSPGNTAVGLTSSDAGADRGEPAKYYPTHRRTYLRLVPRDTVQASALGRVMRQRGCRRSFVLDDGDLYGRGLARNLLTAARTLGLHLIGHRRIDPEASNYRALAASIARRGADCVTFAGSTPNNAVQLFRDLAAGIPGAHLFGPDAVAESSFADADEGGIPASVARRTLVTTPTLAPKYYPAAGRRFFADFERTYGVDHPGPYAIHGYEAMRLVLDAIAAAGPRGNQRDAVLKQLMATHDRHSVLGTYSIDRNGDTSLTDYGLYRIRAGHLAFARVIREP